MNYELATIITLTESISNEAYNLIKDFRLTNHRHNYPNIEDLQYECESFIYDLKAYPTIKLPKDILKNEEIILKYFNPKSLIIENKLVNFYENKNDGNLRLYQSPLDKEFYLKYNNRFMEEKKSIKNEFDSKLTNERITNFLKESNTCGEVEGLSSLSESIMNKAKEGIELGDFILEEYAMVYISENYNSLKEFNEDCEIAYGELLSESTVVPTISYVDELSDEIESVFKLECKKVYGNKYKYFLKSIY